MSLEDAMDYAVKKVAENTERTKKMKENMAEEQKKKAAAPDGSQPPKTS